MAENTKYSAFFLNLIFFPRRAYSSTTVLLDGGETLTVKQKRNVAHVTIKAAEPDALARSETQLSQF